MVGQGLKQIQNVSNLFACAFSHKNVVIATKAGDVVLGHLCGFSGKTLPFEFQIPWLLVYADLMNM